MNPDYERQLEARIDRELRELGELPAPATLVTRVLRAVEQRARLPWYRRSWQTWPAGLQGVSLALLLMLFGGLCWGAWKFTHGVAPPGAGELAGELAPAGVFWRTLAVLGNALRLVAQHLGPGFIMGCAAALLAAYAACIGLGTVYVRFALARR